ncbi:MAG: ribonuclease HII [Acidobacteriaceae bacterium]|nr:ribonuclease HII [Acidobacteriaceae bacterium]MBV9781769.1 ribonuclease HII [Acidobacteriaceae bacterium]
MSIRCLSSFERIARERGFQRIAGVDEVGRGCLFGPVFAAAVVLDPLKPIRGLHDSKILEAGERAELATRIKARCVCWAIGGAGVFEIDQINILQASRLAMRRAIEALPIQPDYLLIDAVRLDLPIEQLALIDGDARCRAIAAASIIAKVHRDECLVRWHEIYPQYNLASNKGYSTPDHKRALREHGPTLLHRFSFEPVRMNIQQIHWTGYITDPAKQRELFDDETAALDLTRLTAAVEE